MSGCRQDCAGTGAVTAPPEPGYAGLLPGRACPSSACSTRVRSSPRAVRASGTPTRSTYVIVASSPSTGASSTRTVSSLRSGWSGSERSAACHSIRPYREPW
ncbi:predicted protein [Streptomyces sp. SPB78]|nr:predicted protein [Streptomyces sp. SPB78]